MLHADNNLSSFYSPCSGDLARAYFLAKHWLHKCVWSLSQNGETTMKNNISILLTLLFITAADFAQADHYDGVRSEHRQCLSSCEQNKETALGRLSCNYYATQNSLSRCENRASAAFSTCSSNCQNNYKDEKTVSYTHLTLPTIYSV